MSDVQNPSGSHTVSSNEEQLILKSLTLPHGVATDASKATTIAGYDTMENAGNMMAKPDWSAEYSQSMRTMMDAAKHHPPEVLHAADYMLEQVARMSNYDEQKIIQARQQIALDLSDGSFVRKVEAARNTIEEIVERRQSHER